MGESRSWTKRVGSTVVVLAMAAALLPVAATAALAAKPPKDDPPPEPTTTFEAVGTSGAYLASGSSLDVPVPSEAGDGDLLIAQIAYNANGTITAPEGWNLVDVLSHSSKPIMQGVYWKAATNTEPAHYSFTLTSGKSDTVAGAIAVYAGMDLTNPIDAFAGSESSPGAAVVAPGITTSTADATLVALFTARDNGSFSAPAGMNEQWDTGSFAGVGAIGETIVSGADQTFATPGDTGDRTATPSASDGGIGHLLALRPAQIVTLSTGGPYTQWEDATALQGVPQGQYSGSMEWITNQITGANHLWNAGYDGSGIDVALIDTGVVPVDGLTQPGKVVNGPDLSFESQADNLRYLDTFGHGTHLAGIIAGNAGSDFSGMAPGARLVSLKVADANGAVDVTQVIAAIDWVIQHRYDNGMNIRVINLAYGTDGAQAYQVDPLSHAVERAWDAGIVVVVAAGNDGNNTRLRNPAVDPFVIAVGAAENDANHISGVAEFSNCGTSERFVDIVAPGRSILSLRSPGSYADQHYPQAAVNGGFFLGSGTSQAAAVVTGGVALLLDQRPDLNPDQVKALLMDNADYVQDASFTCQGAGALDLQAAQKAKTPRANSADQTYESSDGTGLLEAARGSNHVSDEGVVLEGEIDIMGNPWTGYCTTGSDTGCLDTLWDGGDFNGASWSGASWSGASWSGASWSGASWSGASWSGASWSSKSWSGASWSGASWSGASWSGASWSGASWSGNTWSGLSWDFF